MTNLLATIDSPQDLKKLSAEQLPQLASEIRDLLITTCAKNGGHIGTNLGVVELTTALHYVFDSPKDAMIFDTAHQAYTHKILTGRRREFPTICQYPGGLTRFIIRGENEHDLWSAGHASTGLSGATGFAEGRKKMGKNGNVICITGDGALTGGMTYEALNNIGYNQTDIIIVLNDNKMSISPATGAMFEYLSKLSDVAPDDRGRRGISTIFEKMGIKYYGPVDGHDFKQLIAHFEELKTIKGPKLLHVLTQKGKGVNYMEVDKAKWHEHAAFEMHTGQPTAPKSPTIEGIAMETLMQLAEKDPAIVGITAAMPAGTNLQKFGEKFPKQFFDIGIAEEHAVTFAAGLACEGVKPFVAIYSPFLQRGFDQMSHDVAMMDLPVRFLVPKAAITGDGPTQGGVLDLSYLRIIPKMVVMAPSNEQDVCNMVVTAHQYTSGPIAMRYPKGNAKNPYDVTQAKAIPIGKGKLVREGSDVTLLSIGMTLSESIKAADELAQQGIQAEVIDARFAKPLDAELIIASAKKTGHVITMEENTLVGGFGSAVLELLAENKLTDVKVTRLGCLDEFLPYDKPDNIKAALGLNAAGIVKAATETLNSPAKSMASAKVGKAKMN